MRPLLVLLSAAARLMAMPRQPSLLHQTEGEYEDELDGVALFPGIIRGDTRFGVLLAGRANGDLPGTWAGMVHYSLPWVMPGVDHDITGGTWYFRNGEGALYGHVATGKLIRDETGRYAEVVLTVQITSGNGVFESARGFGELSQGIVDHGSRLPRFTAQQSVALHFLHETD